MSERGKMCSRSFRQECLSRGGGSNRGGGLGVYRKCKHTLVKGSVLHLHVVFIHHLFKSIAGKNKPKNIMPQYSQSLTHAANTTVSEKEMFEYLFMNIS